MARTLLVDHTHLGRHVTGLERITLELFAPDSLAPLRLEPVTAGGSTRKMILAQTLGLPARLLADRGAVVLCPGFPPSIPLTLAGGRRVVPYVHDCFLITRPQDLNWRARVYMAPAFRVAIARLPWFLVNSRATADELARHAAPGAEITLYRPVVRDVFAIADRAASAAAARAAGDGRRLSLIAVGTVEPRKNLVAAAEVVRALNEGHGFDATLDVVGRPGWGGEAERLAGRPGVVLHGYQPAERVRDLLAGAHLLISTSHDEGLGLPLVEAQYAGLPVVAPDKPVFREVLGASGLLIDPTDPAGAAARIAAAVRGPGFFATAAAGAATNVARWNAAAEDDRARLVERLARMVG
ncbi:glycosyltransferase [Oharaeibacter diazotrophicus]|uniref:Glycosyltransferase involved in cell wall biosynthesis n=1 Tax=Oharaeibacter diazotrophicus TaxID=1920512 RepID=A0A4R6R8Z8_9HYPH|nr:glycosyltransferase [Oharaeibacter diazotrophicus]TDP82374.1 glycosyltransferase involved in cell wall biosynthesis [Oharaeibacter diazotrophicus]BBE72863.1 D-inositol-3-phosphate glycosyltransferase [Pleomorphomonas sp. SM30]GLS76901.1 hypothetical protein GCM10007904_22380 [Oharaeibacter diazotrophicus]